MATFPGFVQKQGALELVVNIRSFLLEKSMTRGKNTHTCSDNWKERGKLATRTQRGKKYITF